MKKKCTFSSCRRVFSVADEEPIPHCPHCGKAYPRLSRMELVQVRLRSAAGASRLLRGAAHYRRTVARIPVREVLELLENLEQRPLPLGIFPQKEAQQVAAWWMMEGYTVETVRFGGQKSPVKRQRPLGQSY